MASGSPSARCGLAETEHAPCHMPLKHCLAAEKENADARRLNVGLGGFAGLPGFEDKIGGSDCCNGRQPLQDITNDFWVCIAVQPRPCSTLQAVYGSVTTSAYRWRTFWMTCLGRVPSCASLLNVKVPAARLVGCVFAIRTVGPLP